MAGEEATAPTTARLPPGTVLSPFELYSLFIFAGFDRPEATTMTAISLAESGGRVDVVNSIGATGIIQIYLRAHPDVKPEQAKEPIFSAQYAKKLYDGRGGKEAGVRRFYDWEAWTGRDGVGNDGPWQRHQGAALMGASQFAATAASAKDPSGKPIRVSDQDVAKSIVVAMYVSHGLGKAAAEGLAKLGGEVADVLTAGAGAAADLPSALTSALGPLGTIAKALVAAAEWLSDRNNWFRLAKAVTGGSMVLIGLAIMARPAVQTGVKTVTSVI